MSDDSPRRRRRAATTTPPPDPTPPDNRPDAELSLVERILRYHHEGHTVVRICGLADCSDSWVRDVLTKHDLTPNGQAPDGVRDRPLPVKFSQEERETLAARAADAGLPVSTFVRHMALRGKL